MNKTVVQLRGPARAGVPPGTRLNDLYEVGEQIAAGGMGEIYRGHQIATGDPVAIKMIKPEFAGDESVMALFHREASALNRLQHESIVRYYIFGTDRTINRTYLAMEFVEGSAVSDIITRRPFSVQETTELRRRVAAGLQVAHENGIIHRDISPDNVILPEDDVRKAKIIDFGIARSTKPGQATVIGDGFAGKYNYVSPEQAGMFGGEVTARSDIYSLGLLLVTCLLGRPIDMGGSMADVIEKRRVVPDLTGIDEQLRPLIERMLAPDPKDRPASMIEVLEWAWTPPAKNASGGTKRIAAPAGAQAAASGGSKPPVAAISGGIAVLVAGGIGAFVMMSPSAPPQPTALAPVLAPVPAPPSIAPALPAAQAGILSAATQIERIVSYVRYYDGDPCLYLQPTSITERSASIDALAVSPEAVRTFQEDFNTVNGFQPNVSSTQMLPEQCAAVAFMHQIDGRSDPAIIARLSRPRLHPGENAGLTITGAAGQSVAVVVVDEDGAVRNLTSQLRPSGSAMVLEGRLDDGARGRATRKLLLTLVSAQPISSLKGSGSVANLAAVAQDIKAHGANVVMVPQLVSFE